MRHSTQFFRSIALCATLGPAALSSLTGCVFYVDGDDCGRHAYERHGVCHCDDGYWGDPYEGCYFDEQDPIMTWSVVDGCADGIDFQWRLFSGDGSWQWPESPSAYSSGGFGVRVEKSIECRYGERVCFGASAASRSWGCGLDGSLSCEGYCYACDDVWVDVGELTCE